MRNIRAFAAKIINDVLVHKTSLDSKLSYYSSSLKDARDQALLQELCYGTLRWYYQLNEIAQLLLTKPLKTSESTIYSLMLIGLYQLLYLRVPEYAVIAETVDAASELQKNWAKALINGVLRNFLRQKIALQKKLQKSLVATYAHPWWLIANIKQSWPDKWEAILAANNMYPPMHLRVNLQKTSRDAYWKLLMAQKIDAVCDENTRTGITLASPNNVQELPRFTDGFVSVQDLASQLAAELLELTSQQKVLDACAAPGGKLAHILEHDYQYSSVVAIDKNQDRLAMIKENLQRLRIDMHSRNITLLCADVTKFKQAEYIDYFDRILLDAPCSATGVIRRHPDIKVLRQESDIVQLAEQQYAILTNLWPLLKVGGTLLYSTCSVLPQENEQVIARFLQSNTTAVEQVITANWGFAATHGRQIFPQQHGMDGFYYAKLIKKSYGHNE